MTYGEFPNITDAVTRIAELEDRPSHDVAMFLSVYADPLGGIPGLGDSDAAILSRLEYRSLKYFYLIERDIQ